MSSTANARRGAPARPALTAGEPRPRLSAGEPLPTRDSSRTRGRTPRPWAAALQRPAAKILVAGGLTLAGWLLTGALSGSTAAAAETAGCPHAAASTVEHGGLLHGHHRKSHREPGTCAQPADTTETGASDAGTTETEQSTKDTQPAEEPATEPAAKATSSGGLLNGLVGTVKSVTEPVAKKTTSASDGGLLGGLVGGVVNVVGGTLNTVTTTVSGTLDTVSTLTNTLSHTVLAPLTQPPADNPDAPVLLPLDDVLNPILGGSSNSGGVTVTVPGVTTDTATQPATAAAVVETAPAETTATTTSQQTARVAVVHLVEVQNTLPAKQEQPRDSGVHARNGGGDSTPGLPGGSSAPSAPAPTAAPGHDGPGGARHAFAVHTDDVTTTQLKLIGTSRDHEVDGAGREAALPTTSPD
ncbi:hypothetical protein [Amycolatopsis pretoriensis]|uniref:hypothetical protein n=1 Tax=Amycolatopsis pretoriensis TaxID=218821 RepID=UPI001FC9C7DB|nr:hypothetical protein [Amycolatopsis pretoriensis]